jgi:alpha 1,3-mannosyltransferase
MKGSSQSIAEAVRNYDKLRHFVNTLARRIFPWTMLSHPDHMSLHASFYTGGRGIVFTAGNRQGGQLLTVIPSLRQLGCKLPVEVMYLGDEDLDEEMRGELEKLDGVVTRDLRLMIDDDGWHLAGMLIRMRTM